MKFSVDAQQFRDTAKPVLDCAERAGAEASYRTAALIECDGSKVTMKASSSTISGEGEVNVTDAEEGVALVVSEELKKALALLVTSSTTDLTAELTEESLVLSSPGTSIELAIMPITEETFTPRLETPDTEPSVTALVDSVEFVDLITTGGSAVTEKLKADIPLWLNMIIRLTPDHVEALSFNGRSVAYRTAGYVEKPEASASILATPKILMQAATAFKGTKIALRYYNEEGLELSHFDANKDRLCSMFIPAPSDSADSYPIDNLLDRVSDVKASPISAVVSKDAFVKAMTDAAKVAQMDSHNETGLITIECDPKGMSISVPQGRTKIKRDIGMKNWSHNKKVTIKMQWVSCQNIIRNISVDEDVRLSIAEANGSYIAAGLSGNTTEGGSYLGLVALFNG